LETKKVGLFDFVFAFQRRVVGVYEPLASPPAVVQLFHGNGLYAAHEESDFAVFPKALQVTAFTALDVTGAVVFFSQ
jgi:hypothetical protein